MSQRGMSLVETLVVTLLVLLLLGVGAAMFSEYARVSRFSEQRNQGREAIQGALEQMAGEVRESVLVIEPAAAASRQLVVQKLDATRDDLRLPPDPSVLTSWEPYPPSDLLTVRYFQRGPLLLREVTPASGQPWSTPVAAGVRALDCRPVPGGVELELTLEEGSFRTVVERRVR